MRVALAIPVMAAVLASGAGAQEPDHLERLQGECREVGGAALGDYAGRVLWMADGTLSGMLTVDAENAVSAHAPRTLTVRKQTPQETSTDGESAVTIMTSLDRGEPEANDVACTLAPTTTSNG